MTRYAPNFPTVIDVRNFGAKGDGVTNDGPAIQAAIDSLGSNGGEVFLPAGTYLTNQEISITQQSIHISGQGHTNGGNATIIRANASIRGVLRIAAGYTYVSDLFLDAHRQASYGLIRDGDSISTYDRVFCWNAILDGWHSCYSREGYTIGQPVAHVGNTSPLPSTSAYGNTPTETTFRTIVVSTGGTRGTAQVTSNFGTSGSQGAPFTIPADGVMQFGYQYSISGAQYSAFDTGVQFQFPAGTYVLGDSWTVAITTTYNGNDGVAINYCQGSYCGAYWGTTPAFDPGANSMYPIGGLLQHNVAPGTVSTTAGSNRITGVGTSFFATGARQGDYIRVGSFNHWQALHSYTVGDIIWAGFLLDGIAPQMSYLWQASGSGSLVSGATAPNFPNDVTPGSAVPGSSPVGQTVLDGNITWTCVSSAFFQILSVQSNTSIIVNGIAGAPWLGPQVTLTNVDYAIFVGSGWYNETSADSNTTTFTKGVWQNNAAAGLFLDQDFGCEFIGGFPQNNGCVGIEVGLEGRLTSNVTIIHPYLEGNLMADITLGGCLGLTVIEITSGSSNGHVMNMGSGFGQILGQYVGSDGTVAVPIGSGTKNRIPVVWTSPIDTFTVQGSMARLASSVQTLSAGTQINPNASVVGLVASSAITLTATPTISTTNIVIGQEVTLINIGLFPITLVSDVFTDARRLALWGSSISLGLNESVTLRYFAYPTGYPNLWQQISPVVRQSVPGKGPSITLANGINADIQTKGLERIEIVGPTAAFSIAGLAPWSLSPDPYGSFADGLPLRIINFLPYSMTIKHEDSADESTAANRIWCPNATDLVLPAPSNNSSVFVDLVYNATQSRWIVIDFSFINALPSGATLTNPTVIGRTTFQPTSASPITYAAVNSQIFTAQIPSGTATGIIATIPLPGYTGAPIGTGMLELDCETSMVSATATGAARFKHTWQWSVANGVVGPLGPLTISLAVGNNSSTMPTGWLTTVQLDGANQNVQIIANTMNPTGLRQVVNVKTNAQFGYTK